MSIETSETYTYENNFLRYEFRNNDFTNDLYKEFDHKATKLGLNSKIDDLLSGKVVNLTENQAAFHPKYRKNNGFINEFIKSNTDFVPDRECLKDEALNNFADEVAKSNAENIASFRIIADHLRSISFLIADGVIPSNEGRGYVLRRIMRRAMRHSHKLGFNKPVLFDLSKLIINLMDNPYNELKRAQKLISVTLHNLSLIHI